MKTWMATICLVMGANVLSSSMAVAGPAGARPRDTLGAARIEGSVLTFYLRQAIDGSCSTPVIDQLSFGDPSTDQPLAMDTDGDGLDEVAVYRDSEGRFYVASGSPDSVGTVVEISFGTSGDVGISGNFDTSTPEDEVGVFRTSSGFGVFIIDEGNPQPTEIAFGDSTDEPLVGNWDGSPDGSEEIGLFRPSTNEFFFRADNIPDTAVTQSAIQVKTLGTSGDGGIAGDWNRDGRTTEGATRGISGGTQTYINNMATSTDTPDDTIDFGADTDTFITGDFDGPMTDEDGC